MIDEYPSAFSAGFCLAALIGVGGIVLTGSCSYDNGRENMTPKIVYNRPVEGDDRSYLVVESEGGTRTPMVRTSEDEPYRRLKEVSKEKTEGLVKKLTSDDNE